MQPAVPKELFHLQKWFAHVITLPLERVKGEDNFPTYPPSLEAECAAFLTDGPFLKSHQRMGIYNRLYWYRLFNLLHDSFPFVTRLFGYEQMNRAIITPCLTKYPPDSWSLHTLSGKLMQWVQEEYSGKDKGLVEEAAKIDLAYYRLFLAKEYPALQEIRGEEVLCLQPMLELFELPCHLFAYRERFMGESVCYWEENEFPPLEYDRSYYFVLYRAATGEISLHEVCPARYFLLRRLQTGISLPALCEEAEALEDPSLETNLSQWFFDWIRLGWLVLANDLMI